MSKSIVETAVEAGMAAASGARMHWKAVDRSIARAASLATLRELRARLPVYTGQRDYLEQVRALIDAELEGKG